MVVKTIKSTPKLRFPEFGGEWVEKRLGDMASFSKGKGISKIDIVSGGKTPAIRYGELYTTYKEVIERAVSATNVDVSELVLSKANDVIIPASGEIAIDIATASCVLNSGIALGGDLNIIRTKQNGVYLSLYLNSNKKTAFARLAQGNSVVHIYPSSLRALNISLPSVEEQEKIASFLTVLNGRIGAMDEKLVLLKKYKKGIMQKIFTQKTRFKDKNNKDYPAWQNKILGDVTSLFSNRNKKLQDAPVFSVTNRNGFVLQTEHFNKVVAGDDLTNYKLIKKNDFAYNPSRINVGSIARFKNPAGIISSLYVCFNARDDLEATFLEYFLQLERTKFYFNTYGEGGVRIYLWYPLFSLIKLALPNVQEQQKIAGFLTLIDDKIKKEGRKLEAAKKFKKSLLQQMFV